jgi:hypothetical protein
MQRHARLCSASPVEDTVHVVDGGGDHPGYSRFETNGGDRKSNRHRVGLKLGEEGMPTRFAM